MSIEIELDIDSSDYDGKLKPVVEMFFGRYDIAGIIAEAREMGYDNEFNEDQYDEALARLSIYMFANFLEELNSKLIILPETGVEH